ncbi:RagB/SusD family nutrient uptake outer membrane protein [Mucilaginibacter sp. HC2]|uniref:RagB/SusD family nutrient uptake outer membrane protein n=1 Tax=Mucilaginibacter inviolabilis TaxID=2714892 RepID=UPI001409FAAA|nr:RagB/SusD family nutrient uptake outer membrane protein [Mucilaginibacter inviolabilis]NHA05074.1 RagB/SusD family nutrient uptake outer membrane protein [Mucilaginibacter inviolabilis]
MKKNRYIITLLAISTLFYSCKRDYLDVQTLQAGVTVDKLYSNYTYVQQQVWNVYSYLPDGLANLDMEAATDNAEATDPLDTSQTFNTGTWNQYSNPADVWARNFKGIRQANLYLKNKNAVDISYIKDKITSTDSTTYFNARNNVKFMEGEVLFLKAFFYLELVKRYGGVPIFDQPFDYDDANTWKNVQRNSLDESLKYIVTLCDKSAAIIPANLTPYSWYEAGRVTQGAIKALKAKALLYGASPLFKDNGSTVTWAQAAAAAHDVMALNAYSLDANYTNLYSANSTTSAELIFYRRYGAINTVEYANYPIVFQNSRGRSIAPTENFVESFEVVQKDGSGNITGSVPFSWSDPTQAANPYQNRDPRFAATVVYNGSTFKSTTIETFTGGNSGLPKQNATKTGYYMSKWTNQSIDLVNNTTANHAWIYFRYGELLLNYAEAMYNAYGANADPQGYGMTAMQAINKVRQRVKMPVLTALNQQAIEHERNVELSYEDQRFWDVRRWKEGSVYFKTPVNRIEITNSGGTYSYAVKQLEERVFDEKMNWFPIPQSEIAKTNWKQNPGW